MDTQFDETISLNQQGKKMKMFLFATLKFFLFSDNFTKTSTEEAH